MNCVRYEIVTRLNWEELAYLLSHTLNPRTVLFEKLSVVEPVKKFTIFMKPKVLLSCTHQAITGPCPEPINPV